MQVGGAGGSKGLGVVAASESGPLSLVLNRNAFSCQNMVIPCHLERLLSPVQPLPEILDEVKEEAMVAENERGRPRGITMKGRKKFYV